MVALYYNTNRKVSYGNYVFTCKFIQIHTQNNIINILQAIPNRRYCDSYDNDVNNNKRMYERPFTLA